jgi:predicted porin
MQKKIIALAIAGLMSGAAFAQSNVTISGKIDAGYGHTSYDAAANAADRKTELSELHDSSRIEFAGEEALGNGLKAIFLLQYNLNTTENSGIGSGDNGARQQYVGLSGNMGTVIAGKFWTPMDDLSGGYDSMDAANAFSTKDALSGYITNAANFNNGTMYTSPEFSGFQVKAAYGFSPINGSDTTAYGANVSPNKDQERGYVGSLSYNMGNFSAMGAMSRLTDTSNVTGADYKAWGVGASYNFGFATLMAQYFDAENEATNGEADLYSVGAVVPVGNGRVRIMYSANDINGTKMSADGWAIGYDYDLSKRTMLYAGFNTISNEANASFGVNGVTTSNGGDSRVVGAGIIHKF